MSRGKRGPALIELIRRQDSDGIRQPTWFGGRRSSAGAESGPVGGSSRASRSMVEPWPAVDAPAGVVSVRGERVTFSFSSVSAGVAVFILIVLLGGSFLIGRRAGETKGLQAGYAQGVAAVQAGAVDDIEAARRAAPNTNIFDGVGTSPLTVADGDAPAAEQSSASSAASPRADASPWVRGHTYIVVQEFKAADLSDAEAAALFLHENGVETAILESGGNYKYRLVALKGFNRDAPAQREWCDAYHARIKKLGRQFVKAGGRYDLQGYQKKLTGPGW